MSMAFYKLLKAKVNDLVAIAAFMTDQPRIDMAVVHAVLGAHVRSFVRLLCILSHAEKELTHATHTATFCRTSGS